MLLLIPAAIISILVGVFLIRRESDLVILILVLFAFVARPKEGFQVEEFAFAAIFFGFIAYWFLSRFIEAKAGIIKREVDLLLFLFLSYATSTVVLSYLYGADLKTWIGEWITLSYLLFYFPVREYCSTGDGARLTVVKTMAWIALFTLVRNFVLFVERIMSADYLWQIAVARITANEHLLMIMGLAAVVWYSVAISKRERTAAFVATALMSLGVLMGQSRAVWVSYFLGIAVIVIASKAVHRRRIVVALTSSAVFTVSLAVVFFPDILQLIVVGLADRIFSLGTATTNDLSLINRFQENRAVLSYVIQNPILGHGLASPYHYYSLVYEYTRETSFVHSWYLGTLYRLGVVGCLLFFPILIAAIVRGFRIFNATYLSVPTRSIGLFVAAALLAESLAATTETTFGTSDKPFFLALMFALVFSVQLRSPSDAVGS